MDKTAEIISGHVPRSTASAPGGDLRRSDRRRQGAHGEELRAELKLVRMRSRTLAITTAILLLAFVSLAVWALRQHTIFNAVVNRNQEQILEITEQLAVAKIALEESRLAVDSLVKGRIPGLVPFRVDEPISVDIPFVRELRFKPAAPPTFGQECKIVIENDSNSAIRPAMSVLLFDDVGIQLAKAPLMDGILDELRVDEIRSFFVTLEIAEGSVPRYFLLTSD